MPNFSTLSREQLIELLKVSEQEKNQDENLLNPITKTDSIYKDLFYNLEEEVHFWQIVRDEAGKIQTWRLVDVNPPAARAWGIIREDVIGKTADEIFSSATELFMPILTHLSAIDNQSQIDMILLIWRPI